MKVIIIESNMEGGERQVWTTRGTAGDRSGPERSEGSDPPLARGMDTPVFHPRPS